MALLNTAAPAPTSRLICEIGCSFARVSAASDDDCRNSGHLDSFENWPSCTWPALPTAADRKNLKKLRNEKMFRGSLFLGIGFARAHPPPAPSARPQAGGQRRTTERHADGSQGDRQRSQGDGSESRPLAVIRAPATREPSDQRPPAKTGPTGSRARFRFRSAHAPTSPIGLSRTSPRLGQCPTTPKLSGKYPSRRLDCLGKEEARATPRRRRCDTKE
jgi:hypothetical protein